jgi:hypothetical protein
MNIKVISSLDHTLLGRYDGEDFEFVPGEPTILTLEAATFIFQLGEEDKSRALNQLGLLIPGKHTYVDAVKQLDKIAFIEGKFHFDDEDPDEEPDPARAPARTGTRTGGRRPHVHPGGGAAAGGGGLHPPAAAEPSAP